MIFNSPLDKFNRTPLNFSFDKIEALEKAMEDSKISQEKNQVQDNEQDKRLD